MRSSLSSPLLYLEVSFYMLRRCKERRRKKIIYKHSALSSVNVYHCRHLLATWISFSTCLCERRYQASETHKDCESRNVFSLIPVIKGQQNMNTVTGCLQSDIKWHRQELNANDSSSVRDTEKERDSNVCATPKLHADDAARRATPGQGEMSRAKGSKAERERWAGGRVFFFVLPFGMSTPPQREKKSHLAIAQCGGPRLLEHGDRRRSMRGIRSNIFTWNMVKWSKRFIWSLAPGSQWTANSHFHPSMHPASSFHKCKAREKAHCKLTRCVLWRLTNKRRGRKKAKAKVKASDRERERHTHWSVERARVATTTRRRRERERSMWRDHCVKWRDHRGWHLLMIHHDFFSCLLIGRPQQWRWHQVVSIKYCISSMTRVSGNDTRHSYLYLFVCSQGYRSASGHMNETLINFHTHTNREWESQWQWQVAWNKKPHIYFYKSHALWFCHTVDPLLDSLWHSPQVLASSTHSWEHLLHMNDSGSRCVCVCVRCPLLLLLWSPCVDVSRERFSVLLFTASRRQIIIVVASLAHWVRVKVKEKRRQAKELDCEFTSSTTTIHTWVRRTTWKAIFSHKQCKAVCGCE